MRIIYKASLVFLLRDIYSGLPITNAVILCNGKQNPYTRKSDGYYVFSNLYPGEYTIDVKCKGYTDICFSTVLKENETRIMSFEMPYTVDNTVLTHLTRFEMTLFEKKNRLINSDVVFKLKNELSFLKLIEPVEPNTDVLKLNLEDMVNGIIGQKYIYKVKRKEYEIFILGYDNENKCYISREPFTEKMDPGGMFYPVWNLKTDNMGRLVMPVISQFMKDDVIKFECKSGELKSTASFDISGEHQSGKVFYKDVKMRKSVKREKTKDKVN